MNATMDFVGVSDWVNLIRSEYQEMPGLSLTRKQMERLWGLDSFVCGVLVDTLLAARVLRKTRDGSYVAFHSAH